MRAFILLYLLQGYIFLPFITGQVSESPRHKYGYFHGGFLKALREGDLKLKLIEEEPELFNLQENPAERYNRAEQNPEIVRRI